MENIISIYEKLIIKEVTYETGDRIVKAKCDIVVQGEVIETEMLISHTDLNRIIAKITASGCDFEVTKMNQLEFADGTSIVDYSFENVFGESIVLENFQFSQAVKQIRA
jgi:hypothetical protein